MSNLLGQLEIAIRAIAGRELDNDLSKAKDKAGKAGGQIAEAVDRGTEGIGKSLSGRLGDVGTTLMKTLTPVAASAAAALVGIGSSWRAAGKEMQVTTGATGAQLDGLMKSVQNVAGTAKGGVGTISDVMADLAVKTKLTGQPLEDLTRRLLLLKELGINVAAADVGAAFSKWKVPTEQWADALDRLYRVSQATGVSVPTLLSRLAEFAPVLQGLGYNFDQATLLAGRLSDATLPGLRKALADISTAQGDVAKSQLEAQAAQVAYDKAVKEHGATSLEAKTAAEKLAEANRMVALGQKDSITAWQGTIAAIRNAKTDQEALSIGFDAFGSKSAPALVEAIRSGKFEIDSLSKSVEANKNTIQKTAEEHRTFGDRLALVKDRAVAMIGPFAQTAATYATIASGLGPFISGAKGLASALGLIGPVASAAATGEAAMAAGAAASGTAAGGAIAPTVGLAGAVWGVMAPILAVIAVIALLVGAGYLIVRNWETIQKAASAVWGFVGDHIPQIVAIILGATGIGALILGGKWLMDHWGQVKAKAGEVWGWVYDKIAGVVHFVEGVPNALGGVLSGMWSGMVSGFRAAWNPIARTINGIDFTIPSWVPGFGGKTFGLPDLPILDRGGLLTGPGIWAKADYRPEVVAPVEQLGEMYQPDRGRRDRGGGGLTIIVQGSLVTDRQVADLARKHLSDLVRTNGTPGF